MNDDQKTELLQVAEDLVDQANTILIMIGADFVVGLIDTSPLKSPKVSGNVVSVDFRDR